MSPLRTVHGDDTTAPTRVPPPAQVPGGPRPRHPARSEMVRGIGPWAGLVVAVVVGLGMYGNAASWQGRWGEATDLLRVTGIVFGGPLALAVGGLRGGRERRRGTVELLATTARSPLRRAVLVAAPVALWPAAGYLVVAAGTLLATWPYVSAGHPQPALVLADAVALASFGVLGFVVGRLVPWRLTAPLLAVGCYMTLLSTYSDSPRSWLNPAALHEYDWDRPVWWFGPAAIVWTAGLATAALLALTARRRVVALLPLAAACAGAVVLVQTGDRTGDGPWRHDPAASRYVCDKGTPRVCVSRVDGALLPEVAAALAGLNAELRGVPGAPERWVSGPGAPGRGMRAMGGGSTVRDEAPAPDIEPGDVELPSPYESAVRGRIPDPAGYARTAVAFLFSDTCSRAQFADPGFDRTSDINTAVQQWLAPARDFASYGDGPRRQLKRLAAMDDEQSRAYLTRYLAADTCDPDEVPVP